MAQYEHLPIYRATFDLAVHIEKIVHNFSRYYKYTLGTELRNRSQGILERIIVANNSREREAGRRLSSIAECALVRRWGISDAPLSAAANLEQRFTG